MNKQIIVIGIAAVVLLFAGILGAMAFTSSDSDMPMGGLHTMPDGSTMPGGQMGSTDGMHTMSDGTKMPGMDMNP